MRDEDLEPLMARAAEEGAKRALERIGLHDEHAGRDISELRNLLDAWRDARSTVWKTIIRVITTAVLVALGAGLAVKLKLGGG